MEKQIYVFLFSCFNSCINTLHSGLNNFPEQIGFHYELLNKPLLQIIMEALNPMNSWCLPKKDKQKQPQFICVCNETNICNVKFTL